jgi:hypothetical protein
LTPNLFHVIKTFLQFFKIDDFVKSPEVPRLAGLLFETFEKGSILVKVKEDENFNHRNICTISRIEIGV